MKGKLGSNVYLLITISTELSVVATLALEDSTSCQTSRTCIRHDGFIIFGTNVLQKAIVAEETLTALGISSRSHDANANITCFAFGFF